MKTGITGRMAEFLIRANTPVRSKYYQGTEGVPNVFMDEKSTAALQRRGLVVSKVQNWTTPAGDSRRAVFWLITEAGKQALRDWHRANGRDEQADAV